MTRVLIVFGSTDGHTARIVNFAAERIRIAGCLVDIVGNQELEKDPDPGSYDGVIVAASVHAGRYQKAVHRWVSHHRDVLNQRPSAFLSVCLAVLQRDPRAQAEIA